MAAASQLLITAAQLLATAAQLSINADLNLPTAVAAAAQLPTTAAEASPINAVERKAIKLIFKYKRKRREEDKRKSNYKRKSNRFTRNINYIPIDFLYPIPALTLLIFLAFFNILQWSVNMFHFLSSRHGFFQYMYLLLLFETY